MKAYEDYIYGRLFYVYNDHQRVKYVKGTDNWAESHKANVVNTETATLALLTGEYIEEALRICHKGTEGHGGMGRTVQEVPGTSDATASRS